MAQVPSTHRVKSYTATAGQTTFIYDFKIYEDEDIKVQQNGTTLTLTTDYTVTDAGEDAGGTVVLGTGATVGDAIILTGNIEVSRETTFTNGGEFSASAINEEFNKILLAIRENVTSVSQCLMLESYDSSFDTAIPTPVANKCIKFNSSGDGLEISTYDPDDAQTDAEAAQEAAEEAQALAEAAQADAETAETNAETAEANAQAYAESINNDALASDIIPDADDTRDLGSPTKAWAKIYGEDVYVGDALAVTGATALTGNLTINTDMFEVLAASGNTTVGGTLSSTGDFDVATDKFTVAAASGNTSVGGTLSSTGDFDVATDKFTVAAASGNTDVAGTMNVAGDFTVATNKITLDADAGDADFSGDVVIDGSLTVGGSSISQHQHALYTHRASAGVDGGGITAATWTQRPLNYEAYDDIGISRTGNVLTLPAGDYIVQVNQQFANSAATTVMSRIYDEDEAASLVSLGGCEIKAGDRAFHSSAASFTLASETDISIEVYSSTTQATYFFGEAVDHTELEIYASIHIIKM